MRINRPNLERLVDRAVGELRKRRSDLRRRNAVLLRRLVLDDFDLKSGGGRGVTGRWRPISEETIRRKGSKRIGIEHGDLRASLVVRSEGDLAWSAEFTSEHAAFFDATRPLLPDGLPDVWDRQISESIVRWGEDVLRGAVE